MRRLYVPRQSSSAASLRRLARVFWVVPDPSHGFVRADDLPPDQINPKGHSRDVLAVAFTPDGKTLVTAGSDGLAKLWDVADGSVRADLAGHQGTVLCLAISPDGKTVATGGEDMTIRLWATSDGASLGQLSGHSGAVAALAFAPDGKTLASGSLDATVRLWDVASRGVSRMLEGHAASVQGVAFAPDGKSVASASRDGTVKLWDVVTGKELTNLGFARGMGLVRRVRPRRQDRGLGRSRQDGAVLAYSTSPTRNRRRPLDKCTAATGARPCRSEATCWRSRSPPTARRWPWPRPTRSATRPVPGSIEILNVANRQITTRVRGHLGAVRALAFSPDGKNARLGWRRSLDPALGREGRRNAAGHLARPLAARTGRGSDHDEPRPGRGTGDHSRWQDGRHRHRRPDRDSIGMCRPMKSRGGLRRPSGAVRALAISPDGSTLATGGDGKVVKLWDLATGQERATLSGHAGRDHVRGVCALMAKRLPRGAVMPRSRSGTSPKPRSGQPWPGTPARSPCVAFAADGKSLATGSLDWTVKVWDVTSGSVRHSLEGHRDAIDAVAFASDGATLASSSRDGMTRLWEVAKGSERAVLRHTPDRPVRLALPSRRTFPDHRRARTGRSVAGTRRTATCRPSDPGTQRTVDNSCPVGRR